MSRNTLIVAALIAGLGGWHYYNIVNMHNPAALQVEAAERAAVQAFEKSDKNSANAIQPLAWSLLEKARPAPANGTPFFPDELKALDGKDVLVAGVFSTTPSLRENKIAKGGFLQPPSKFQCCGVTCDPRTQLLTFVDCSAQPWTMSEERMLVHVRGKLKLETEDQTWGLFSLNDARIELLPKNP